jgi:hypothetical protein
VSVAEHSLEDYSLSSDSLLHTPTSTAVEYPLAHIISISDTSDCIDQYYPFHRLPMDWLRPTTSADAQSLMTSESMPKVVSGI